MKKMRILSMLLALLLVFSLSLSVLADDAAKITVESWTEAANAGDEVTLAVSIENNPGFLSAAWEIGYDSSKLALQSINTAYNVEIAGKTVEIPYLSGTYASNPKENIVTFMNTTLVKDDSTIFTLTFLVKEGAAGEAAVSVTAKELFAKEGETVAAVSVPGGVTIAESTGGSTTGGSTTGGSTTGGSTTGGSTTGGSTTGGSTTGSSTTGGSTTGGSTTGGSTTGGSTTGGSTTGGSTTGGSTTGGSTTGGSTTGGSTTGGSTTGGSTTGGSTTGAIKVTDIAVGVEKYTVIGQTVTVTSQNACKLGYLEGGKYVAITPTDNGDGSYSFEVPEGITDVVLVIKGDINGDGEIKGSDITQLKAGCLGKLKTPLTELQIFAGDIVSDGEIKGSDITQLKAAFLGKIELSW